MTTEPGLPAAEPGLPAAEPGLPAAEPGLPAAEPIIIAADIAAGHDGQAEISVHVRYANGAIRDISFPHEAIGPVLDATGITALEQLVGQPWTILLGTT